MNINDEENNLEDNSHSFSDARSGNNVKPTNRRIGRKQLPRKQEKTPSKRKLSDKKRYHQNTSHGRKNNNFNNKAPLDDQSASNYNNTISDNSKLPHKAFIKIMIVLITKAVILGIIILAPILLLLGIYIAIVNVLDLDGDSAGSGYATGSYYNISCENVTVLFTDKSQGYKITGSGTYPLEEYVAGVINAEVGGFNNLEVYKEFAVAARSYFADYSERKNTCVVESSDIFQVFAPNPNALMRQAAEETKGQVLLDKNGHIMQTEYDAFCSIDKDDNYYTIKQKNQRIPISWVDSQPGIIEAWKQGNCAGNHGRGTSQWGSYYLATEKDYKYMQLLNYYYSTDDSPITISSQSFNDSNTNLNIRNTTNDSNTLNEPITSFLSSKGSSLEQYNNFIKNSVDEAGYGTRAGVVAAAVSMINYLYDNFNTKLPYYWGGQPSTIGIPNDFGTYNPSEPSMPSHTRYPYVSFDCKGLVRWAIINGGYGNIDSFSSRFSGCNITNSSCKGEPGDVIDTQSHIIMIVSVDEANNRYYVAESSGNGVIIRTHGMHEVMNNETTKILKLGDYYSDSANVRNRG